MQGLDPTYYVDPEVFERERRRIFQSTWQLLGPAEPVMEPGSYLATEIAGAKVMVVRDREGFLRAFRNVCRHRGARLLPEGTGSCQRIRCPYHHWVYELDGSLVLTPWFDNTDVDAESMSPAIDHGQWPLTEVEVAQWRGLLFVAIDPIEDLTGQLGAAVDALRDEPLETYRVVSEHRLVFDANWKIYTDNFVEGYHIPGIHPTFFAAIDFTKFETTAERNLVRMTAPPRDDLFYRGTWLWMWPNWTLSLFDGGMNTSRINPLGPDRTELVYHFYFADRKEGNEQQRQETIAANLAVVEEDFEVCVETHRNYATGGYRPGPLSPRHELGVYWFQQKLLRALGKTFRAD